MNKPIRAFTGQILHIDDVVVYLKTEKTSINTIKKCKFIGEITEFVDTKVKFVGFLHQMYLLHQTRLKIMGKLALIQMMS